MSNSNLKWFYNSREWKAVRLCKLANVGYMCEQCGGIAEEVHHKILLDELNTHDPNISLNQSNLIALCKECHNLTHNRFKKKVCRFDQDGNPIFDKNG
jgi:5-methylcytosine-specific restriction endonuclease McrA